MDASEILLVIGGVVTLLGALTASIVAVIQAARGTAVATQTRDLVVAGAEVASARGVVRDADVREIFVRVNSRLTAALRLLVVATRRAAESGEPEDVAAYVAALEALDLAEEVEASSPHAEIATTSVAESVAVAAEARQADLLAAVPPSLPPRGVP